MGPAGGGRRLYPAGLVAQKKPPLPPHAAVILKPGGGIRRPCRLAVLSENHSLRGFIAAAA